MKKAFFYFIFIATVFSCKNHKALLPNISGKAGEVLIVCDYDSWKGELGESLRRVLEQDCPGLPQREKMYNLTYVTPNGFNDLFKPHRNIVLNTIEESVEKEGISIHRDVWAAPQWVIQISAKSQEKADSLISAQKEFIVNSLEQAERDRIIANCLEFETTDIAKKISAVFGGSPHFPVGYKLRKIDSTFAWVSHDAQQLTQGIFIYKYPAAEKDNFTLENIIDKRNEILKANVPGMFEGTYMKTAKVFAPTLKFLKYQKRDFAECRGLWEVEGDFMGGPFVSHLFYSQDGKEIIVLDAWVYAPKFEKRQYLRQVEAINFSFSWEKS